MSEKKKGGGASQRFCTASFSLIIFWFWFCWESCKCTFQIKTIKHRTFWAVWANLISANRLLFCCFLSGMTSVLLRAPPAQRLLMVSCSGSQFHQSNDKESNCRQNNRVINKRRCALFWTMGEQLYESECKNEELLFRETEQLLEDSDGWRVDIFKSFSYWRNKLLVEKTV